MEMLGLNWDSRFPTSAGFRKMEARHVLPNGKAIVIRYQCNSNAGKVCNMKITSPQMVFD